MSLVIWFGGSKALEISHYRCMLGLWEGLGCSFQSAKTRSRLGPHRVAYSTLCKDGHVSVQPEFIGDLWFFMG